MREINIYVRENLKLENYFHSLFFFLVLMYYSKNTKSKSKNDEADLHRIVSCGQKNRLKNKRCTDVTTEGRTNNVCMLEEKDEEKDCKRCNCTTYNMLHHIHLKEFKGVKVIYKEYTIAVVLGALPLLASFQMNIAKWDDEFINYWNKPCWTAFLKK